jgi:hypothetical protein
MRNQIANRNFGNDESRLVQTQYWMAMFPGITPEMLYLTGFWNKKTTNDHDDPNYSQNIELMFGGAFKFHPLPGKEFAEKLGKVLYGLNLILQIKRRLQYEIERLDGALKLEWHRSDADLLPKDLDPKKKEMIQTEKVYIISDDPQSARHILAERAIIEELQKNGIGYYSGIYTMANTLFGEMLLDTVSMSLNNLSLHGNPLPPSIRLEDLVDVETEDVIEGRTDG